MSKIFKVFLPFWWQVILLFGGIILQINANLQLPNLMSHIINSGIANEDYNLIWSSGAQMLLVAALGGCGMIIVSFFASRISAGFARDLRAMLFRHILSLDPSEIDRLSTASLITRSTNDTANLQNTFVMVLRIAFQAPITAIGAINMVFITAPSMSWILALVVAVLLGVAGTLISLVLPRFKIIQTLNDKLNLVSRENLSGIRVVRAFNNEKYEESKFQSVNRDLTRNNIFVGRIMFFMSPAIQFIMSAASLLILWVGAQLVADNQLLVGDIIAFSQYTIQVMMSFMMLTMAFVMTPRAIVSMRRINEILQASSTVKWGEGTPTQDFSERPSVKFKNVSFNYKKAEKPALKNINFEAKAGEVTAIIGSTGSGKSTLIDLITRSYDSSAGEIYINGIDIKKYDKITLMDQIGLVPQKNLLFSGSIESNLKFGNPKASSQEINNALKIAQADNFVKKLDKGTKSWVAQGGKNFSGGQRQRLCIARAIIKQPKIYIFDDSFSALDYQTDLKLRQSLKEVTKDAVVIIVAQRISTIRHAENILVLDNGKIKAQGTHAQLLKSCQIYQEIASSQLSQKELAR